MYAGDVYTITSGTLWNNSATSSTTISWGNEPPSCDQSEWVSFSIPLPFRRVKRSDKLFRRAIRQYEERVKARRLMVAPLEFVTCSSSRTPACAIPRPPRTRERASFRSSVLERQALPRDES